MQATSDKTASANFTQTGHSISEDRDVTTSITNGKTGYNPYYQWGRKDAFRSAEYTEAPAEGTSLISSDSSVTIGTSIQTPTTMYCNDKLSYAPVYYNAWNAIYPTYNETTDNIPGLEKTVKTVYDPCPVGYTVPPANTFIAFNMDNFPVDGNGRKYTSSGKSLYFPYAGSRTPRDGELNAINSTGFIWQANLVRNNNCGRELLYTATTINIVVTGDWCADVKSIRPVREN